MKGVQKIQSCACHLFKEQIDLVNIFICRISVNLQAQSLMEQMKLSKQASGTEQCSHLIPDSFSNGWMSWSSNSCRGIVIRHIVKKKIIEDIGNDTTNPLIDDDPFNLVSNSHSIMGNRSINESRNRQRLESRLDVSRPDGIVERPLKNRDLAEDGVVDFEVSRGSKGSHLEQRNNICKQFVNDQIIIKMCQKRERCCYVKHTKAVSLLDRQLQAILTWRSRSAGQLFQRD